MLKTGTAKKTFGKYVFATLLHVIQFKIAAILCMRSCGVCVYLTLSRLNFFQTLYTKFSPYLTGNTLLLRYKAQPVNAV
jgi:hypothetical protein